MEIPNKLNYLSILLVIGIFVYVAPFYINYVFIPQCNHSLGISDYPAHISLYCPAFISPIMTTLFVILGAFLILLSTNEVRNIYNLDRRVKELDYATELNKNIEYFNVKKRKHLLTTENKYELEKLVILLLKEEPTRLEKLSKRIKDCLNRGKPNHPQPPINPCF